MSCRYHPRRRGVTEGKRVASSVGVACEVEGIRMGATPTDLPVEWSKTCVLD
jgi:hypothetical protein